MRKIDCISLTKNACISLIGNDLEELSGYYFNARWYDPELGRFITEDPVKDEINFYAYAGNNPLIFIDPTGLYRIYMGGGYSFDTDTGKKQ